MIQEIEELQTPAYFPCFVACIPPKSSQDGPEVISHWKPRRTNIDEIDYNLGRDYCREAISFRRQIRAPHFLVCVLREIRFSQIGTIERGFIDELSEKATAGGNCPIMSEQEASSLAYLRGCDFETIRDVEIAARDFILAANQIRRPDILYSAMMDWLQAPDGWVSGVVALAIAGAAIKRGSSIIKSVK